MANPIIGGPNLVDASPLYTPSFSGGTWNAGQPLTNLADADLDAVARSTGDAVADTVFTVDLGVARAVKLLAIPKHNLSASGTVRVRGFSAVPILDVLDFSTGWTANGTPVLTPAAYDGSGADGVPLDLVEDNDAGVTEGYVRTVAFTGDGVKCLSVRMKAGTAASSVFRITDNTAVATRLRVTITWTAGVPNATASTGTVVSTTLIGDGVYRFVFTTSSITAANTNQLGLFAATNDASAVAHTGTTYMGVVLAWDATTDQLVYDTGFELAVPSGLDAEESDGLSVAWYHVPASAQTARYWRFNFNDTTNADGYVQLHRLFIASGFQPTVGVEYGAELSIEDDSETVTTEGGADFHIARNRRRIAVGALPEMPESDELLWRQLLKRVGKTGQVFYVHDPDDTTLAHERAFLGCFMRLDPISFPTYARARAGFAIRETL